MMKASTATALLASALIPVSAFAAEGQAPSGFYNVETGKVVSGNAFVFLSAEQKVEILTNVNKSYYFLDGNGNALNPSVLLTAKTNEEVDAAQENVGDVEDRHNVVFTEEGEVVISSITIESLKALNKSEIEVTFSNDTIAEEADLQGRQLTLTRDNGDTLSAIYKENSLESGKAVFGLIEDGMLTDTAMYKVKGTGFSLTKNSFQARFGDQVATSYTSVTTTVVAGDNASVYIEALDQYGESIEVPANVVVSGTLNGMPLTTTGDNPEVKYDMIEKAIQVDTALKKGDKLVLKAGTSTIQYMVIEGGEAVLSSFKISAPSTLKSGESAVLKVIAKDQFENPMNVDGDVRWVVNGAIQVAAGPATYEFNEVSAGDYQVDVYYVVDGKIQDHAKITVTVEKTILSELILAAEAKEDVGFTTSSWEAFQIALAEAKVVAKKANASQAEVQSAYDKLVKAENGLTEANPSITAVSFLVGGESVKFTGVEGASASIDLSGLDAETTATEAIITATKNSTMTLTYGDKKKVIELKKGENTFTPSDLIPGLEEGTSLSISFLQSLEAEGLLKITTLLDNSTGSEEGIAGTLTITYDSSDADAIKEFIKKFDTQAAFNDIQTLTDMGPRVTGTLAEQETIELVRKRMEGYGYAVTVQEFDLPSVKEGKLTVDGQEVESTVTGGVPTNGTVTAALFYAGLGKPGDFTEDVVGKIVLIERGELTFVDKVKNAKEAGAVGVIIYNNADGDTPLKYTADIDIPAFGVTKAKGQELVAYEGEVSLQVEVVDEPKSANVIATKLPENGAKDADIVYVSAHIDSVPGAPGANDNASGTAAALEMARTMKDLPLDKELRFAFVGAEEIGLVGSKYYVDSLSEEELSRSVANFNMDMVATSWDKATAIYTNTLDGEANIVTNSANKVAKVIRTPSELVLFKRGSSDHVSFYDKGIPSANFIRREPGTHNLEPDYHNPKDTMDNVSKERLEEMIHLVGGSVYSVVRKKQ
ncbi:M20/M25/M40 family metallo-hydrolase [Sporosarcina ureae]|nr:M20/M25/M40 family metallo-hydrolase [Sporosarcina ureae]